MSSNESQAIEGTAQAALERPARRPAVGTHSVERVIGGIPLTISTGLMAKQADGAVVVTYGGTMVLVTAQAAKPFRELPFFPLTVEYREKTGAAGKIPGGFIKREGRPSQKEILTMRMTDRTVRPLFPAGFRDEVQIVATVLSADPENDPDALAITGASAALHISRIPFHGAVGGVRVGLVDGEFVINPTHEELDQSRVSLIVAGHRDAVTMVEGGAAEASEDEMLAAIQAGHEAVCQIAEMIEELREKCGVVKIDVTPPETDDSLVEELRREYGTRLCDALLVPGKHAKARAVSEVRDEAVQARLAELDEKDPERSAREKQIRSIMGDIAAAEERSYIVSQRKRIDSRELDEIRPISIEVGLLPRCHGSALFTRGETQALVTVTLGTSIDAQRVDGLGDQFSKRLMLDYNFPPFCVGEVRPIRGPGRREIGHGSLAERALLNMLPAEENFAYTIRAVSEILESNGSSSMATVCGTTMAMLDGAVPLIRPVAGIAMGLIMEGDEVCILSDILGSEDHHGDMDFKVAGTSEGITALQMDIKATGVATEIMRQALHQACRGRLEILEKMNAALPGPRDHLSPYAPRLLRTVIPVEKIGTLIGPGGRTIKAIQEKTGANIEVEDDGAVMVSGKTDAAVQEAMALVEGYTGEVELDKVYEGTVVSLKDFGAFVEILPGQEGLLHISEMGSEFVRHVEDVLSVGDRTPVRVINIDPSGRIRLSRRDLEGDGEKAPGEERRPHRGPRDGESSSESRSDRPRRGERSDSRSGSRSGRGGSRRDEGRRDEGRRDEGRRDEGRRDEGRRSDPRGRFGRPRSDRGEPSSRRYEGGRSEDRPRDGRREEGGRGERRPRDGRRDDERRDRGGRRPERSAGHGPEEGGRGGPRGRGGRESERGGGRFRDARGESSERPERPAEDADRDRGRGPERLDVHPGSDWTRLDRDVDVDWNDEPSERREERPEDRSGERPDQTGEGPRDEGTRSRPPRRRRRR